MDDSTPGFTAEQAVAAQREMRRELGLGAETFPLPAFVGMISDEIEQLRAAGRADTDIAALIERTTGREISVDDIDRFYAPPEDRRPHG